MKQRLNEDRLIRINSITGKDGLIPISKSSWWNGVKSGLYPQPIKLGPNTTAWRWSDIQHLIEHGIDGDASLLDKEV